MEYHYLATSLFDLSFDDKKTPTPLLEYIETLREALSEKDLSLLSLFSYYYDNKNLIDYFKGTQEYNSIGGINPDVYEDVKKDLDPKSMKELGFPPYLITFFTEYYTPQVEVDPVYYEEILNSLYYQEAINCRNSFVSSWFEFNLNINNILSALTARKYGLDVSKVIFGSNEVANAIKTTNTRDWGLVSVIDYADSLFKIAEEPNLVDRERRIDQLRWKWLEEHLFFEYFSIEKLMGYLFQMQIIDRWSNLDKETGEKVFREMIGKFKESIQINQ